MSKDCKAMHNDLCSVHKCWAILSPLLLAESRKQQHLIQLGLAHEERVLERKACICAWQFKARRGKRLQPQKKRISAVILGNGPSATVMGSGQNKRA